ncbi:hypothetical protein CPT_Mendera_041 [Stenotrophomonas phage Mendera]|uniref:7-cyano-7-deazaguanine synthase n=1 Tax=Stenotrophomonas phage Mendera TaxID=2650877 RepID=A0A5P8PKM9_9CAUD|nr:QueC-like queuosine biosynthesis [Stenotrophomonas phage Mendera]QFR56590.1 hypothetical protein CPT_Mendera_041 [Stenotrophomonas phage Mendera]QXN67415.1 hypothetical protein [Stenotrophomonas phage BUCT608]QYC97553.1 hypothetical protein [Stenotrophomonas phage BUCT608]
MSNKKILILYSGGLDSMMMEKLAQWTNPTAEITCVFYEHGQDSLEAEIAALPWYVKRRKIDWLDGDVKAVPKKSDPFAGAIYIPGRNLVFAVTAASQFLPDEIWMGTLFDECNEQATDKNNIFLEKTNAVLKYVLSPFGNPVVKFPFVERGWTKTDALGWLLARGVVSKEDIAKTTSCWHNDGLPCGECKQCLKRALIMDQFDIYEHHAGLHPLDPTNKFCADLIEQYEACLEPNIDEREVQRLIRSWRA